MTLKDRYLWLFRKTPALTLSFDADGRILDASDAWLERMSYSREALSGKRPEEICTPESAEWVRNEVIPLLRRAGRIQSMPVDMVTAQGEVVHFVSSAVVEHGEEGAYLRTVAIYTELRKQADIEKHYRELYRATPAMLYTLDAAGRIIAVSNRWLRKLGYNREEVLGKWITDFMSSESRERVSGRGLEEIISAGDLDNAPREFLTRSGETIEVLVSATPERDRAGRVTRLLVAMKDVTSRNRAERRLREAFAENAQLREQLERERDYLREEVNVSMNFGRIIGESPGLRRMLARLNAVSQTSANVLVLGESGVGKELIARAIHARSPRNSKPLVKVNCASIPRELFESEFFGHVKGAFTGATRDRIGRFQLADGGTIFLDEVGEIPVELQGKLLRVLQEREFERVGDDVTRRVDVRVIAATNQDLERAVDEGRFREDLYYRLSVFPIDVPPLRERGDDVLQLAVHFVERACREFGVPDLQLTRDQAEQLLRYDWPGNVRELQNVIERAVILARDGKLRIDLRQPEGLPTTTPAAAAAEPVPPAYLTEEELRERERDNLVAVLEHAGWRVSGEGGAAELLGVRPSTLADRIRRWGIRRREAEAG